MVDVREQFNAFTEVFASFFQFVASKLQNFKNLTLGEQIAYCCAGAGILFIIIGIVLFLA